MMRLDVFLVANGYASSRERAKELIRNGQVRIDGRTESKPARKIPAGAEESLQIEITGDRMPYVSRGGLKLQKALECFSIDLDRCVCMDAGASTGGFTDCMLQHGAAKVYAVDVGTGQLDPGLRNDKRVVSLEQTNMRYLKPEDIGEMIDFISIDVSFISLRMILPPAAACLKDKGEMVCLIKPQFEAGVGKVSKKGVVRDSRIRERVICDIIECAEGLSLYPAGLTYSPIRGPEGNVEYLLRLVRDRTKSFLPDREMIRNIVGESEKGTAGK